LFFFGGAIAFLFRKKKGKATEISVPALSNALQGLLQTVG